MANKCEAAKKVMRLKLQLTDEAESATLLKTLQKLRDMDITIDILSETGIGKAVNSLRRNKQVGEFAKSLVKSWKSLIPKHSQSQAEDGDLLEIVSVKDKPNDKDCTSNGTFPTNDLNNNPITSNNYLKDDHFQALNKKTSSEKHSKERRRRESHGDKHEKGHTENNQVSQQVLKSMTHRDKNEDSSVISTDKNNDQSSRTLEDCDDLFKSRSSEDSDQISRSDFKAKTQSSSDHGKLGSAKEPQRKSKTSKSSKGSTESLSLDSSENSSKPLKVATVTDDRTSGRPESSEAQNKKRKKPSRGKQSVLTFAQESVCMESSKLQSKRVKTKHEDKTSDCDSEEPSMSFESYLNYDENVSKRRERSALKKSKRAQRAGKDRAPHTKALKSTLLSRPASDKQGSVMDLINIPLPADLLKCERPSHVEANNFEKKVEREPAFCDVPEEPAVFPGQRLNKKMQVYSGAKSSSLPTMMSLHQQCIRTLQNNINLLYETGGVPFEILEPVLERCTPEQLLRIEEYNPIYVGVTDHLWGKHCKREFKDSRLLEYESWKEMYLRLSEEREMKLQRLTKSIVSAHSNKPKGRQVKMAFIHTVAKPPRDVRIQQEIHGTAVQQPPQGRCSAKAPNNRLRPSCPEPNRSNTTSPASGNTQDPRKKSRVAPMMAKSLKAFKKQMGRR